MDGIGPLSRQRVGEVLRELGLRFLTDADGDFVLLCKEDAANSMAMVMVSVQGSEDEILAIQAMVQNAPPLSSGEALGKANEWNATRRWPRAFVKDGHFFLDFHLDLEKGVHKELLKDVVATVLAGVSQFLLWLGGNGEEDTLRAILRRLSGSM